MSLKKLNHLDNLYTRLFQLQLEGYWKEADEVQKEIRRLEDHIGEDYQEPRKEPHIDVC